MALKFPNVFLGTASYPPQHWGAELSSSSANGAGARCCSGATSPPSGIARQWLNSMDWTSPTTSPPTCSKARLVRCSGVCRRKGLRHGDPPAIRQFDYDEIVRNYPPPPEYFQSGVVRWPRGDRAHAAGTPASTRIVSRPSPFFAEMWEAAGFDPPRSRRSTTSGTHPATPSTTSARASRLTLRGATTKASRRQMRVGSRCECSCRAAPPGSSRPTFYTHGT